MLDSFPRTGSTTLLRVLNAHPDIECCMEPFHPKRYAGEFNRLALQGSSVIRSLELIKLRWNGLKHVWEPGTAWPFVGHQHLNDDLIRQAAITVTLRRRNLLRQFVSNYICKKLGFWVGTSNEFIARLDCAYLPPVNICEAAAAMKTATIALSQRDELLSSLSSQFILYYEDIFEGEIESEERVSFCNSLFMRLGHRPLTEEHIRNHCLQYFSPAEYRWSNNEVYDRLPGSRLLDAQLGNDVTGRLFS